MFLQRYAKAAAFIFLRIFTGGGRVRLRFRRLQSIASQKKPEEKENGIQCHRVRTAHPQIENREQPETDRTCPGGVPQREEPAADRAGRNLPYRRFRSPDRGLLPHQHNLADPGRDRRQRQGKDAADGCDHGADDHYEKSVNMQRSHQSAATADRGRRGVRDPNKLKS